MRSACDEVNDPLINHANELEFTLSFLNNMGFPLTTTVSLSGKYFALREQVSDETAVIAVLPMNDPCRCILYAFIARPDKNTNNMILSRYILHSSYHI